MLSEENLMGTAMARGGQSEIKGKSEGERGGALILVEEAHVVHAARSTDEAGAERRISS
jgi:hypothetical protein